MKADAPAGPGTKPPSGDDLDTGSLQQGRRKALRKLSALMGASLLPGLPSCGGDDSAVAAPADTTAQGAGAPGPSASLPQQIDVGFRTVSTATQLDGSFAGFSFEKDPLANPLFTPANTALIRLFGLLGPGVMRIGANGVDRTSWRGLQPDLAPIQPAQIDALAGFLQATQWRIIYGVNQARNTSANAASEAAYVSQRLGSSLLAWEIGNEPDLYRRNNYRPDSWTYADYLAEWRALRNAMSAASPNVPFSGPATSYNLERFTFPFARDEGARISLLTHHYYRADRNDPDSNLALLLQPDPDLPSELASLVKAAADAGTSGGFRMAEANSFFGGGVPNVSNAFGTALWVIDFLFTCALAGSTGVNLHGGGSGPGYTPIAEQRGTVVEARAEFYGMVMFAQAAQGTAMDSVLTPRSAANVSAWGVKRPDGGLNAILLNKDPTRTVAMNVITGVSATSFTPLWLRGTSLSASSGHTLGGSPITRDGNWSPQAEAALTATGGQLAVSLPPASALLLRSA